MSAFVFAITMLLSVVFAASCSFMEDDEFFGKIENEVAVANADKMSVYIRYANTRFGKTSPADAGYYTAKNNVAFTVSATTNTDYGFFKWAAFSTKNFNPSEQYSALVYNSDEEYNQLFAPLELPETIVKFSSKNSQSTEVTIYATRDDIWLIPIVVNRPVISTTFPDTSSNPVRNASLRVQFSKPMDEASFKGNYSVGEGNLTDQFELNLQDITDLFEIKLSESKKLVTFSFKNEVIDGVNRYDTGFKASSNVQISFTEDITDVYGYKMASSASVKWRIGTTYDRAAPIIEVLTGGTGSNFSAFESVDTPQALAATNALANYPDTVLAQRSTGKVNFYVYATDIAAKENSAKQESDVQMIGFRATSLTDMEGNSLDGTAEGNYISQKYETYAPALNYSEVNQDFTTLMPGKGEGCLYTYDLSSLPDGLIKVDVWAMDMTGNNGLEHYDSSIVYDGNHNGYRSIFVVKDSKAPAIETEKDKVRSSSSDAPYGWYNASSFNPIKMNEMSPIVDLGNEKLRSPHDKIKWMFRLGADTNWSVTTDDASWKLLTTPATPYEVGLARVDSEGLVSITMRLMDDLGNIADPVAISSAYYDETPPVISALSWVNSDGTLALNATKDSTLSQILKIPFTEEKSGIKRIEIKVEDSSGNNVPNALAGATISYSTDSAPSGAAEVTYDTSDPAHTGSVLVFTDSVTTGNLYVSGLNIRNSADETFTVKVKLLDAAINSGDKETNIKCDITDPVVKDVSVVGLSPRATKNGSADGVTKWLPYSAYDTATQQAVKARVSVNVEESCSGIYEIKLGEDAYLTDSSYITIGDTALAAGTDFSLNVAANTILMSDMFSPKLKGDDITFIIENVKIDNDNSTVKVSVKDFGLNGGDKSLPNVMKDSTSPAIDSIVLSDRGEASGTLPSVADADGTRYTNDRIVDLTINGAKDGDAGSGLRGIVLDSGATFTDTTTITVEISGSSSNCTFTKTDDKTVTFDTAYAYDSTVSFVIKNISLDSNTDGVKTVNAHLFDMCGWKSEVKTDSIILDTTPPGWLDKWIYVADSGNVAGEIYPATGAIGVEAAVSGEPYFYTKNANAYLSVSYSDANFYGSKYSTTKTAALEILSDSSSVDLTGSAGLEFQALPASGSTSYSIVLRDKAGNVSPVKTFHAVSDVAITKDTGSPAVSLTNRMAKLDSRSDYKVYLEGPSHRNRFSTSGTTGADDYKVYISVSLADYTEKTYTTSQSGLAKFAINDSSTAAPSESGSGTDFNKWIPYSAASGDEIKVWIPSDDNLRGPYYLWLMDNVGNTNCVQIRTPANETAGNNETWLGKASVNQIGTIDYVNGTSTESTTEELGKLVTSTFDGLRGNVTYYNDEAKIGFAYDEGTTGIDFSGAASATNYPVRVAIVKKTAKTAPSKSDLSDTTEWIYPDTASGTAYTFTNKSYPKDLSETEKYGANYEYLYYIIEDAVGHVNTGILKPGAEDSQWKYDNDAPKVTLRTEPDVDLTTLGAGNLSDLVPMHYGVQAFYDNSKVWVPATAGDISETVEEGDNTYHSIEKSLYFDLSIAESTKITKFYYSTSSSAESYDSPSWQSSSDGKVDVCIPVSILSSATDLYLHVCDIVGNIKTYQVSALKWQADAVAPDFASGTITPPYKLKEGYYYALPNIDNNTIVVALSGNAYASDSVKVTIPLTWFSDDSGSGVYAYSFEDSEDNPGSIPISIDIDSGDSENTNHSPCIKLTKGIHYERDTDKNFWLYVYDFVGNCKKVNLTTRVDTYAPVFKLGFDIDGTGTILNHPQTHGEVTVNLSGKEGFIYDAIENVSADKTYNVKDSEGNEKEFQSKVENQDSPGYTEANPYIIYASPNSTYNIDGKRYFIGTFTATDEDTGAGGATLGISDIKVDRKLGVAGSTWENDYLTMSNLKNYATDTSRSYVTKVPIDLDDTGRFYRITVSDYAGNTTEVYIKLFLDVTEPAFTSNPTVEATTGSINTDGTNYYFNEMKLDFTGKDMISDTNSGLASGTKNYEIVSGTTSIKDATAVTDSDSGFEVSLTNEQAGFASHTNESNLYVRLSDKLGNSKDYDLYLGGTKIEKPWVRDTEAPTWPDWNLSTTTAIIGVLSGSNASRFTLDANILLYTSSYKNRDIELKPTAASDTGSGIMGYVLSTSSTLTGPYSSSNFTGTTATLSAASTAFVKKDGKFTFKVSNFIDAASGAGSLWLYAVDYAGNMTKQELQILEDAGYPVVSSIVASTSGDIYCDSSQNYYNTDAKIKVTASVTATRGSVYIWKYMFKNTDVFEDSDLTSTSCVNYPSDEILPLPSDWTAGDTLYLHLVSSRYGVTATPVKLTGEGTLNSTVAAWTKDTTPPVISLSLASGGGLVIKSGESELVSAGALFEDSSTYITNAVGYTADVALTDSGAGVASSNVDGGTDNTASSYTVTANSAGDIVITAKDHVGNESSFTLKTELDITAPSVSNLEISNAAADDAGAVHSVNADSSGVIYFNPSHINVSVTTSDTQTTVAGYLVDSSNRASATSGGWTSTLSSTNFASADGTALYLHVKDTLNNVEDYPFAGNAKYTPMGAASASTAVASATWKALTENTASVTSVTPSVENGSGIYYDSTAGKIWYNPNFNGSTLSLSLTPAASGSLVKGFRIGAAGSSCDSGLTPSLADGDIAIYSVDYAGNISTSAFNLNLIDDSTAPSIVATLASGEITSDKTALIADGAALASGTEYFTNSDYYTSSIAITEEGSGVDSVTDISGTAGSYSVSIDAAGEKTVTAKDKVGNEGTFTFKTSLVSEVPAVSAVTYSSATSMNLKDSASLYFSSAYISAATITTPVLPIKYELSIDSTGVVPSKDVGTDLSLDSFSGKSSGGVYIWSGDVLGNTKAVLLSSITATYTPLSGTSTTITGPYNFVKDSDKPAAPNSVSDNQGDNTDFDSSKKILYYNTSVVALEITPTLATADDSLMGFMSAADSTDYFDKLILSGDSLVPGDKSFYSIDYAGNVSESSYNLTLKKAVSYKIEGKKITLSDFPEGETIASITLTASAGSFPALTASPGTASVLEGGASVTVAFTSPSSLTSVELTSESDISGLTISKIVLSSSAGSSIVDIIPSNPSNYISVPGVFAGSFPLMKSTERALPRGRSITHEDLMAQKEALLSLARKNVGKTAAPKADLTPASAVATSTGDSAWSGLSRDFNSESENLDRAVSRLKSSAAKASSSEKASTSKTVSKVKEESGIPEVEAKVSVTESVAPSVEKVAPVSVTQQDSAEKPFRKIGLLILLAVFVLSGAFFAKKVEIFHKKS
ncbi:MAG: hypothetical protein IJJ71_09060 [Treponema sp.]|uniref:hypothetical protein n=1 Tax=Treponema sp. TaxID=166 RepID=UPI0025D3CB2C|nr:hypothetical protein [Treponema sp.]MBR0496308.1 hypothetical protein [Treponema sp.]